MFNGQHTIEIVALVSGSRETPVWCMVYDDLVYTQEADIFANQMKYVKSLLPYEIFMANIEAGNDRELIIRDLVESYDLTITSSILSKEHPALRLSYMQSLFYLIPNSSSAPSATLYMNTHSKYLLLPDTLSCKQIQCDI